MYVDVQIILGDVQCNSNKCFIVRWNLAAIAKIFSLECFPVAIKYTCIQQFICE